MHSQETRKKALSRLDRGESPAGVAQSLGVPKRTLYRWRTEETEDADEPQKEECAGLPGRVAVPGGGSNSGQSCQGSVIEEALKMVLNQLAPLVPVAQTLVQVADAVGETSCECGEVFVALVSTEVACCPKCARRYGRVEPAAGSDGRHGQG
jgi:hypothetical protein